MISQARKACDDWVSQGLMPDLATIWQQFFMIHKKRANRFCFVGWLSFSLCSLLPSRQCRAMSATAFPPHQQPQVRGGRRSVRPAGGKSVCRERKSELFFQMAVDFPSKAGYNTGEREKIIFRKNVSELAQNDRKYNEEMSVLRK